MSKLLLSIPDKLANQFKAMVPARQRSHFLVCLIRKAIQKQKDALYSCAKSVEADSELNQDMQNWNITLEDGLDSQNWEPIENITPRKPGCWKGKVVITEDFDELPEFLLKVFRGAEHK